MKLLNKTHNSPFKAHIIIATFLSFMLTWSLVISPAHAAPHTVEVANLKVNGETNPIGVEAGKIRFSWQLTSSQRDTSQQAYRIQVSSSPDFAQSSLLWDSQEVSDETISGIPYEGDSLTPDQTYYWRVWTETNHGSSSWSDFDSFHTSLEEIDSPTWVGQQSEQIGSDWDDYIVEYDFAIISEASGILLRAQNTENNLLWQFNTTEEDGHLTFKPHVRVGGAFHTLDTITIPHSLVPEDALEEEHHVRVVLEGEHITTFLNGIEIDSRTESSNLQGGIGFRHSSSEAAVFNNIRISTLDDEEIFAFEAPDTPFTTGTPTPDGLVIEDSSPLLSSGEEFSNFELEVDLKIISEAATLYFHARDEAENSYMWQINTTGPETIFKPHVRINGGYEELDEVPIDPDLLDPAALSESFTFKIRVEDGEVETFINEELIDTRTIDAHTQGTLGFRASPTEAFEASNLVVSTLEGEILYQNLLTGEVANDEPNPFEGGEITNRGLKVSAEDFTTPRSAVFPRLRYEFELEQSAANVSHATWYTSALGLYSAAVNGNSLNDDYLAPGWTDYRERIQYQSTHVTDLLHDGQNVLTAQLAPGWYSGSIGWFSPGQYGDFVGFWGQLRIHFKDGSHQVVSSNDEWLMSEGPLRQADLLQGEVFDARLIEEGWDKPDFETEGWRQVEVNDGPNGKLLPQVGPAVKAVSEITPVERTEVEPGVWVFDLGQQISGVVRIRGEGQAGDQIQLRHAQGINTDGTLYRDNLAAGGNGAFASQTDEYTLAGGAFEYQPRFTYHGFRYVEVTGYPGTPELSDVTGVVLANDVTSAGDFETADPMLNQLHSNISWSLLGNMVSIPTDTNARAERLGWTGDATFSADVATFNWDVYEFYRKWMRDVTDSQSSDGLVSNVAPLWPATSGGYGGGWGDAVIAIPYAAWQRYGDTTIIEENYEAMKLWIEFLEQHSQGSYLLGDDMAQAGDWMAADAHTPGRFTATAYFAWGALKMAEIAEALGYPQDESYFKSVHQNIAQAYEQEYVAADGSVEPGTQAGYVLALYADLVPDDLRDKTAQHLVESINSRDNHLSTGFAATGWLLPVLDDIGETELALEILRNEDYPSWGYMIANGATTIWERWDFIHPDTGTFHPDTNGSSDNHAVFGSVGSWMYNRLSGVTPDPNNPGYRHFYVQPQTFGDITSGTYDFSSRYGRITADWSVNGEDGTNLKLTVPVGSQATVILPAIDGLTLEENGIPASQAEGIEVLSITQNEQQLRVGSGTYEFHYGTESPPIFNPTLSTDLDEVRRGETFEVRGIGFAPKEDVEVSFAGNTVELQADNNGKFTVPMTVPGDVDFGEHAITAIGDTSKQAASLHIYVIESDGENPEDPVDTPESDATSDSDGTTVGTLPTTGVSIFLLLLAASLLILGGHRLRHQRR